MTAPAALIFDLDGTIVNSEPLNAAALEDFCRERGAPLAEGESVFVFGRGWREIYGVMRLEERLGLPIEAVIEGTAAMRERRFGDDLPLLPGVRALMVLARSAGIVTGIVTGSARVEAAPVLRVLGPEAPAVVICAEDVPRGKPDPIGFLTAAARLGVDPARCLVVEDSAAGIAAALAAGMRVLASAAGNPSPGAFGHQDQSRAHHRVASLAGLGLADLAAMMAPDPPAGEA